MHKTKYLSTGKKYFVYKRNFVGFLALYGGNQDFLDNFQPYKFLLYTQYSLQ